MNSFPVELLTCPNGHREVALPGALNSWGVSLFCARCEDRLSMDRLVMIWPERRHSEMPCHGVCVLV